MEYIYRYDNVTSFYNDATKEPSELLTYRASQSPDQADWRGSNSFEETCQRYVRGFPDGTAEARKLALKLTPFVRSVKSTKRGWKPSMHAGGNFILDAYNRGIPECCNTMQPVVSKKFASLILNGSIHSGVSSEVVLRRGIAVVALSQILEQHGYRVAIKWCDSTGSFNGLDTLHTIVTVKEFNQPAELDRLSFFLADTSMERRLYFAWQEASKHGKSIVAASYGQAIELPASEISPNDIYLGCASASASHWYSIDTAQAWIKETLKRYGVEFYG